MVEYHSGFRERTGPAENMVAVTPSDSADLAEDSRALYIGSMGNVSVNGMTSGSAVVFTNVPAGTILPIRVSRVRATGTTATGIVALY